MRPMVNFGSEIGSIRNSGDYKSVELFLPEESPVEFITELIEVIL
jgi:hypothetical protein